MVLKLRQPYIRQNYALPDVGMLPIPIEITDPIVDFYIALGATNEATFNPRFPMKKVLDKVEIVDGSDVLFSLCAEELVALDFYHYKESLDMGIDERPGVHQVADFNIPLGLGRVDPVVAFDPTQFANPTLNIYWDMDTLPPGAAGGFVDDSLRLDIMADVIDETPTPPAGYLMTKLVYEWNTDATGTEYINLPVDYPYRTIFVRANMHGTKPWGVISKVRHDCDEQKYQPFEIYTDDWMRWCKKWYGFWHQGYEFYLSGGSTQWRDLNLRANLAVAGSGDDTTHTISILPTAGMEVDIIVPASVDYERVHVKGDGALPCGAFAWPYGDPDEPEEWLDVTVHKKSRLTVSETVDDCVAQVFLTQYRKY